MKRVVIDASSCLIGSWNPNLTGIGRTTLELIRTLEARNNLPFELVLFCQRLSHNRLQHYNFTSKQFCLPLPRFQSVEKIKSILPVVETLTGADIYHIPHNHSGFFRNNRTILTIHDAMIFDIREDHLYSSAEKHSLKCDAERCSSIITCSISSKRLLLKYLDVQEDKITVAPWGYDKSVFFPYSQEQVQEALKTKFCLVRPYLLSVSCNIGRKRTPELIRQYLKLASKDYPYDLVLVWRKPSEEVRKLLENSAAAHRVHIIPSVNNHDLALLYNGTACMVFPSIYEGFGLPVLEAMACGRPVMITHETSLPEIGGNAAIYFDTIEEDNIGEKLLQLADGQFNLEDLSRRSLIQASKFSWEQCADITISVYNSLL